MVAVELKGQLSSWTSFMWAGFKTKNLRKKKKIQWNEDENSKLLYAGVLQNLNMKNRNWIIKKQLYLVNYKLWTIIFKLFFCKT